MKNYKKIRGIGIAWTALLCFFSVMQLSAQSAVGSSGPSPLLTIDGQNYQGYCVEYTQAAGPNGHGYNFDTTPEDITNPNVTAAMRGQSQYGTSATQSAIWYFTDNVTVSTGSSAQQIINKVLDGTYSPMCASEWTPNNYASYQDVMTGDDPYCAGESSNCTAPNVTASSNNSGCNGSTSSSDGTVTIYASGGSGGSYYYSLSGSDWTTNSFFSGLQPGSYIAYATTDPSDYSCEGSYTINVGQDDCGTSCTPNLTINNNGSCPVDIFYWSSAGDQYYTTINHGNSWTTTTYDSHMWRAVSSPADFNNLTYDENYTVNSDCNQVWNLNPNYCSAACSPPSVSATPGRYRVWATTDASDNDCRESVYVDVEQDECSTGCNLNVDLGNNQAICSDQSVTLSTTVTGASTCNTPSCGTTSEDNNYEHGSTGGASCAQTGWCRHFVVFTNDSDCAVELWCEEVNCSNENILMGEVAPGGTYSLQPSAYGAIIRVAFEGDFVWTFDQLDANGSCNTYNFNYSQCSCSSGGENNDVSYLWSTGATSSSINVNQTGDYTVTVTDCEGCTATDVVSVNANTAPSIGQSTQVDGGAYIAGNSVTARLDFFIYKSRWNLDRQ